MAKLALSDILDGISLKLHAAYPAAQIHAGSIKQGIKPGDFNIINVITEQERKLGVRYSQTAVFDVVYYGRSANADEYLKIAGDAMLLLSDIETPQRDILHAASVSSRIDSEEKVLHIGLTFNVLVYINEDVETMATLQIEQES